MKHHSFWPGLLSLLLALSLSAADTTAELKSLSLNGGVEDGKARLIIEANLRGLPDEATRPIVASTLHQSVRVGAEKIRHALRVRLDVLQGEPREISLPLGGEGEIRQVTGEGLLDWSMRRLGDGTRALVLRPRRQEKPLTNLVVSIEAESTLTTLPQAVSLLTLGSNPAALSQGFISLEVDEDLAVRAGDISGLIAIETKYLPEGLRHDSSTNRLKQMAFRFQGGGQVLPVTISVADPEARGVALANFSLTGTLRDDQAAFELQATARIRQSGGAELELLSGPVALSERPGADSGWRLRFANGRFFAVFPGPGEFPLRLRFHAAVRSAESWQSLEFRVAPASLRPLTIRGLPADTQFRFPGGARPERQGENFLSHLPPDGSVALSWKTSRAESEGRLFYSAEMLSQISVAPGLLRQVAMVEGKVMQGELNRLALRLSGEGVLTRVVGEQVLSWNLEPLPETNERRLIVQFNQAQKESFNFQVQMQSPLGAFPQSFAILRLAPEGATRFAGYHRVVNEGAVRLEVTQSPGLSQVSPEQFPETAWTRPLLPADSRQRFVYRFSGPAHELRIQADNVLPEVSVSELLAYHLGETELGIDGELELDIREAPLREVTLNVPKGYAVARLQAAGLADYFLREPDGQDSAELRLVFTEPWSGRQVVQLRLERNRTPGETNWTLPRVEIPRAKSVRGHVAVSADAGWRLSPATTVGLTEIATAFFPRKVAGIQSALRLSDAAWQATLRLERLPQSIQVDGLHLFSIGEGVAYGSSVLNYQIAGAPVAGFRVELSAEYFNVEFLGKDVRNWQKTSNGFEVFLHTPVSGAYTLLAAYERPFKGRGETLTFTGARPLDAQTEQGHTIVVSAYQLQVTPANVSSGLLALEPAEVPSEYRLFFDAPILAAYRYTARPFNLQLVLSPLAQGDTLGQVADRAGLKTRISKEGQIVTDARYFVKNRGQPHFRLTLPEGVELWSALVNGGTAVPVRQGAEHLIPLPQQADPNAVATVDLKLAARSPRPERVVVAAPVVGAPVLLAEWQFESDTGQRLEYLRGSLAPARGPVDASGFARLGRWWSRGSNLVLGGGALGLLTLGLLVTHWSARPGIYRFSGPHLLGLFVAFSAFALSGAAGLKIWTNAASLASEPEQSLAFVAPVQQAGSRLVVEVANLERGLTFGQVVSRGWPVLLALPVFGAALFAPAGLRRSLALLTGWTLLFWTALRWPEGLAGFALLLSVFIALYLVLPALRRLFAVPRSPGAMPPTDSSAPAVAAWLVAALWLGSGTSFAAEDSGPARLLQNELRAPAADLVRQEILVEDHFAFARVQMQWSALKGQLLPVLVEPAVLTRIDLPTNAVKLVETVTGGKRRHELLALTSGRHEISLSYQLQPEPRAGETGFRLPTASGLAQELTLTLRQMDVEIRAPSAVSLEQSQPAGTSNTVGRLILPPAPEAWIGWKPRSRDTRREKAVFYAEVHQLYVPAAGVIEGQHQVLIRPSHGELGELLFTVPAGAAITDVLDPATTNRSALVSLWRFDPETRQLRVTLRPAQSRPFQLVVKSQFAVGPLPVQQSVGLLSVNQAAGQMGLLGVATGPEVQLDTVTAPAALTAINLEDFPPGLAQRFLAQFPGLTLRRAFRYADPATTAGLNASAVEPDVRVESQQTLSLGEDRTLLAVNLAAEITRAGIFRLSFVLPPGLDLESMSGPALSHWTELRADNQRIITLHLHGKTEGAQQFSLSLTGPGLKGATNWSVPKLLLREATKQRGQLILVPEQGLRLQVAARAGVTQLDPQRAGVRQKGVLAFRLLASDWALSLDLEQVEAWVQVNSLQHVAVGEAQSRVTANLQYQIENAGLKTLRVFLPTNADSVQFRGDQVADFLPRAGDATNGLREWEVKLHRRMLGSYLLQASYQMLSSTQLSDILIRGVEAAGVNLQRGYLTVESSGRLRLEAGAAPAALQPSDWQSVPRALRQDLAAAPANFTYRLVEPTFALPVKLERHEAARLLPARVSHLTLKSVISDDGMMLTQARLDLAPGDKRLLKLTLPAQASFWFAFVNQNAVAPWLEQDRILIPIDPQSKPDEVLAVEVFFSSQVGKNTSRRLDLQLLGPKFDLPLEDITWQVYLNEKWRVTDWDGTLQLVEQRTASGWSSAGFGDYLQQEAAARGQKTKIAEQQLLLGNNLLAQGAPQQARQAFQNAFGLSRHDLAFNEDARVQLHNLKMQQALVGLNVRQNVAAGESGALAAKLRELRGRRDAAYTQDEARQLFDNNRADDNAALVRLAERLVQQQDAAVASPAAIRAAVPEQGRLITFKRAVQVDTWSELRIELETKVTRAAPWGMRLLVVFGLMLLTAVGLTVSRKLKAT